MLMVKVSQPDRDRIVHLYTVDYMKARDIADLFPFSYRIVCRVLREEGVTMRPPGWQKGNRRARLRSEVWDRADEVVDLYVKKQMSTRRVAAELSCSTQPVINILKSRGIRRRTPKEARRIRADKYGIGEPIEVKRPAHQPDVTVSSKASVAELRDVYNLTIDEIEAVTGKDRVDIFKELQS